MSTLVANKIVNHVDGNVLLKDTGSIIQVVTLRFDSPRQYIIGVNDQDKFRELVETRMTITPKSPNSRLIVQWEFVGEPSNHNSVIRIYRDGALTIIPGEEGCNADASPSSNFNFNGYWCGFYDKDFDSTANKYGVIYSCLSRDISTRNYSLAFGGALAGSRFNLNTCLNSPGQTNRETLTTTGVIYEVAR